MPFTFNQLVAGLHDEAMPLAVSRRDVLVKNDKLGRVLVGLPAARAARLARQIGGLVAADVLSTKDAVNINSAAKKRSRKFAKARELHRTAEAGAN